MFLYNCFTPAYTEDIQYPVIIQWISSCLNCLTFLLLSISLSSLLLTFYSLITDYYARGHHLQQEFVRWNHLGDTHKFLCALSKSWPFTLNILSDHDQLTANVHLVASAIAFQIKMHHIAPAKATYMLTCRFWQYNEFFFTNNVDIVKWRAVIK